MLKKASKKNRLKSSFFFRNIGRSHKNGSFETSRMLLLQFKKNASLPPTFMDDHDQHLPLSMEFINASLVLGGSGVFKSGLILRKIQIKHPTLSESTTSARKINQVQLSGTHIQRFTREKFIQTQMGVQGYEQHTRISFHPENNIYV